MSDRAPDPPDPPEVEEDLSDSAGEAGGPDGSAVSDEVQVRAKHVAVAVLLHIALIASTVHFLGVSIPGVAAIVFLFFIFPGLSTAVARAWP